MKRRISIGFLIAVIALVIAVPVLASYYANLTVVESSSNDYTELGMQVALDVDYLADNGYITSTGLDTRVTSSGTDLPHMMVDDTVLFVSDVEADGTLNLLFETGETALASFPIVVGDGGYVTFSDHANLELGDDFEIEFEGYLDVSPTYGPTVSESATSTEDSQVTSHTVDLPSGIESGDLLVMLFSIYDPEAGTPVISWPGDWTGLVQGTKSPPGDINRVGVAYRVANGGEGSSATVTTGADSGYSAHQVFRVIDYTGVPTAGGFACGSSVAPDAASLASGFSLEYVQNVLWITLFGGYSSDTSVSAYPTNYDDEQTFTKSSAGVASLGSAQRTTKTTTEDAGAWTTAASVSWVAYTVAIAGSQHSLVYKDSAFGLYFDEDEDLIAYIDGGSPRTLTNEDMTSGEYLIEVYADGSNFYLDIDGATEDSIALGGASVPDNANAFILRPIYWDYYTHTTSSTLRITYEPDSIIVGTTLPNETSPGTYDGAITLGSNPAGVTVSLGGLVSDEQLLPAGAGAEFPDPQDIAGESGDVGLTSDLGTLSTHPFYPIVSAINETTGIPIGIVWVSGASLILAFLFVWMIASEGMMHQIFLALAGGGWVAFCYHQGVYPFWVIFIYAALATAIVIGERSPTIS